jgi:predicted dehydrogenase
MPTQLRWGVLGLAGIARAVVIPAIQSSMSGRVVAVASRRADAAQAFAEAHGIPHAYPTYEALLSDPGVDAVYLPLPNAMHEEWAVRAAEAGKPVLCEKPLSTSAESARRIVDACALRRVCLMENFMYRHHPQHRRVQELIAEGAIGEVREVRAHLSVDLMHPPDPANVRFQPALGGGAMLDMVCYSVNIARMIMGEEPTRVHAFSDVDSRFGVDVTTAGLLEFSKGRTALVSGSFLAGGQGTYSVVGSNGTIEVPRAIILGLGTRDPEGLVIVVDTDGRRREEKFPPTNQYRLAAEAFASAVLVGGPPPVAPIDSVRNAMVLDALAVAARSGQVERVE